MPSVDIHTLISNINELQCILLNIENKKINRKGDIIRLSAINEYVDQALLYARNVTINKPY